MCVGSTLLCDGMEVMPCPTIRQLISYEFISPMKRIKCTNCKAYILADQLFCSVCLAMRPKKVLSAERVFALFILLWASGIMYWLKLTSE